MYCLKITLSFERHETKKGQHHFVTLELTFLLAATAMMLDLMKMMMLQHRLIAIAHNRIMNCLRYAIREPWGLCMGFKSRQRWVFSRKQCSLWQKRTLSLPSFLPCSFFFLTFIFIWNQVKGCSITSLRTVLHHRTFVVSVFWWSFMIISNGLCGHLIPCIWPNKSMNMLK